MKAAKNIHLLFQRISPRKHECSFRDANTLGWGRPIVCKDNQTTGQDSTNSKKMSRGSDSRGIVAMVGVAIIVDRPGSPHLITRPL